MLQHKPADQCTTEPTRRRWHDDQGAVRLGRKGIDGAFELAAIAVRCPDHLHAQCCCCRVDNWEVDFPDYSRNEDERNPGGARCSLLEQLQPFASDRVIQACRPCGIAFGSGDVFQYATFNGVPDIKEDNGDAPRSLKQCEGRGPGARNDTVRSKAYQ